MIDFRHIPPHSLSDPHTQHWYHSSLMLKCLPGWWFQPLWKIWKSVGKDDIPYIMENKIHVPNHQPASCCLCRIHVLTCSDRKNHHDKILNRPRFWCSIWWSPHDERWYHNGEYL
jgi:hypothetical protein